MISKWVGLSIVYHKDLNQHLLQFVLFQFNVKNNRVWKGVWIAVLWSIWNHMNGVVYRDRKVDAEEIFSMAQLQAWAWMKRKIRIFGFSYTDWVLYPLNYIQSLSWGIVSELSSQRGVIAKESLEAENGGVIFSCSNRNNLFEGAIVLKVQNGGVVLLWG